jgi:hypothetical protein
LSGRAGAWNLSIADFQIVCSRTHSHYKQQGLTMMFIGLFTSGSFNDNYAHYETVYQQAKQPRGFGQFNYAT